MATESQQFYSSDRPITSHENDRFDRWPFAQRIAETIARRRETNSLVIGIYGPWGDGKTSVLRLMEEAFKGDETIVVMYFNPWLFESESQLIVSFFRSLSDALGKKLQKRARQIGRVLEQYGASLSAVSIPFVKPGEAAREIGKVLSTVRLEDLKKRFQRLLDNAKSRVVVLIDDIDRLEPREIQAIFKLVKLSGDFEKIAYVLAFDDDVVAKALGEKYGSEDSGREFLEKIIQVPLHLPPVGRTALRKLTFEGINAILNEHGFQLTKEEAHEFTTGFVSGLEVRLETPRQAKRYSNALTFCMPLLKGEVHPVDQMLVEGVRVFYPGLYDTVRSHPDVCLGRCSTREQQDWKKNCLGVLDRSLEDLDPTEQRAARELLQTLFPQLRAIFGNTSYGSEWDGRWAKQKRICSERYFARYFQYTVPSGDLSDAAVIELLKLAESSTEGCSEKIREHSSREAIPTLVAKLHVLANAINMAAASSLAKAIVQNGDLFPKEETMFGGVTSTWGQASVLVFKLLIVAPVGTEREELAKKLMQVAEPLPFAIQCFFWFRRPREDAARAISSECEVEIGKILAGRIAASAVNHPPYALWPEEAYTIFALWNEFGPTGDVSRYLEDRFLQHPEEVTDLIASYAPRSTSLTGICRIAELHQQTYAAIAELVPPDFVMKQLRLVYGEALDNPIFRGPNERPVGEALAHQFAFLHGNREQT
jgi:predicted KAP-like P-loop ATPase